MFCNEWGNNSEEFYNGNMYYNGPPIKELSKMTGIETDYNLDELIYYIKHERIGSIPKIAYGKIIKITVEILEDKIYTEYIVKNLEIPLGTQSPYALYERNEVTVRAHNMFRTRDFALAELNKRTAFLNAIIDSEDFL